MLSAIPMLNRPRIAGGCGQAGAALTAGTVSSSAANLCCGCLRTPPSFGSFPNPHQNHSHQPQVGLRAPHVALQPPLLPPAGDSKMQALLHGHSYTAHPLGCSAALEALDIFQDPALNPNLCLHPSRIGSASISELGAADLAGGGKGVLPGDNMAAAQQAQQRQHSGCSRHSSSSMDGCQGAAGAGRDGDCEAGGCGRLMPLWSEERVKELSRLPGVEGVVALGKL